MVLYWKKERLPCFFWWAFWEGGGGGTLVGSSVFLKTFELYHLKLTAVWDSSRHCNTSSHINLTSSSGCWLHFDPLPGRPRLWVSMTQYPAAGVLGVPPRGSDEQTRICISFYCFCACAVLLQYYTRLRHVIPLKDPARETPACLMLFVSVYSQSADDRCHSITTACC